MRLLLSIVLFALALSPATAQFGFSKKKQEPTTVVEFFSDKSTITAGEPFTIALKLSHPETWHSYYINTGTVGLVLNPGFTLPEGFTAERVAWPVPHTSLTSGFKTFGYEGTVTHLFKVTPPDKISGDSVTLSAKPGWQICDPSNCVNEPRPGQQKDFSITLTVADTSAPNADRAADIQAAQKQLPIDTSSWTVKASDNGKTITLDVSLSAGQTAPTGPAFLYDEHGQLDSQAEQTYTVTETGFTLKAPRSLSHPFTEEPGPVLDKITGVLAFEKDHIGYRIDHTFTGNQPTAGEVVRRNVSFGKLATTLGLMFLGGLILNLMPCVFPVIGLKIMGFVQQAGHDKGKIVLHGLLFATGVLVSFWVMAGILFAGGITSWGSQLENPVVIFTLLIIMLLLAMNMYGVFEIGVSATSVGGDAVNKDGLMPTFLSGVLATVIATPCAGPFLGAAIGVAVTLPGPAFFASFTAMALGLSAPYLFLSFKPELVNKLPRPGAWMTSFKQGMSFLLFGTVGFLLWVYSTQVFDRISGLKGLMVVLGLTSVALAAWIYGRWSVPGKSPRTQIIARILAVGFLSLGSYAAYPFAAKPSPWQTWSPAAQAEAIASGKPVFIDFTAKWCATCQTNKLTAYSSEVMKLVDEKKIILLKADKTNPDPKIEAELSRLERSAIPVNVYYRPGSSEPTITPTVLTSGYLSELFSSVDKE